MQSTPQPINTPNPLDINIFNTTTNTPSPTQFIQNMDTNITSYPQPTNVTPYPVLALPIEQNTLPPPVMLSQQEILHNQLIKCDINATLLENNLKIMNDKINAYYVARNNSYSQQPTNDLINFYNTDDFYNSVVNFLDVIIKTNPDNLACLFNNEPTFCYGLTSITNQVNTGNLLVLVKKYQPTMTSLYNVLSKTADITALKCGQSANLENLRKILAILCGIVNPSYDYYYMGAIACLVCVILILVIIIVMQQM